MATSTESKLNSKLLMLAALLVVLIGVAAYVFSPHPVKQSSGIIMPGHGCSSGQPIPGLVRITVPANTPEQDVRGLATGAGGTLSGYSPTGFMDIAVAKGTEASAVSYLKQQPLVQFAGQEVTGPCPQ